MPPKGKSQTGGTEDATSEGGQEEEKQTQNQPGENQTQSAPNFETWIQSQPAEIQTLINARFTALENSVKATRKERDTIGDQLKEAAKKVEAGSEMQKKLTELATQLESANSKADFLEDAPNHECRNARAAYALMTAFDLRTRTGEPDWKAIREMAPELFGKAVGKGNAGAGTEEEKTLSPNQTMNSFIRRKGAIG